MSINIWPPLGSCGAINPERTHLCTLPAGHEGDHVGEEMPTVTLDEEGA